MSSSSRTTATAEHRRLAQAPKDSDPWRLWGPYMAARQWGTVREDYSADGNAWAYLPFDHAHQRAYRWGEDGLAGLCDRFGFFNVSLALWNGEDDRLKERLFGLTNGEGNHGEDVKEVWWPTDATPTHSYGTWLYRYPLAAFPYNHLRAEAASRGRTDDEYELIDTGVFDENRFFDIEVTHAKANPTDICLEYTATNHGPDAAPLDLVPQAWFRNTWSWGRDEREPSISLVTENCVRAEHGWLGDYELHADGEPRIIFCDNETNEIAVFGAETNPRELTKDGINQRIVAGESDGIRLDHGTKVGFWYHFEAIAPGESVTVRLRLRGVGRSNAHQPKGTAHQEPVPGDPAFGEGFDIVRRVRAEEADEFYAAVIPATVSDDDRHIARRAFAGLLWGKQLYRYYVEEWLEGDPAVKAPLRERVTGVEGRHGRNVGWRHLALADVISMPDEWEYPWFAAWDLAFHTVPLAHIDPEFAKHQLVLMCREWAQHPNGQLPAYEWAFEDVNPPVHAWACWQVYAIDGGQDQAFLIQVFNKLLLNFSWWVNRKDAEGSYLFEGGFLGMDNIALFDRSTAVPPGYKLEQSDATSWMAFFSLSMLRMALELARHERAYDNTATTFLQYFINLAHAMDRTTPEKVSSLWNEEDGFFYDALQREDGEIIQLRVRSMVGLLPLMAVLIAPSWVQHELPDFVREVEWMIEREPAMMKAITQAEADSGGEKLTMTLISKRRRGLLLERLFDENEFLSEFGIRSLSAAYREEYTAEIGGRSMSIRYTPGESDIDLFGGNSNWRGPVWFPVNFLVVDSLRLYAASAEGDVEYEYPTGSGRMVKLSEIVSDLEDRLVNLFRLGPNGRPGDQREYPNGPLWDEHVTFSEYFHGDTGVGLGAAHQTGWTALVAHYICSDHAPHLPGVLPGE